MFDNIRGVVYFSIISPEPEKLINILKNSFISCKNLSIIHNEIYGQVYRSDFESLKEISENNNAQIEIKRKKGVIFKVKKYKMRFGISLGIVLGLALIMFLSNIVMVIEISGNYKISEEQILAVLDDNGVSIGSFIPELDFRRIEKKIIIGMDNLAWIGIRNTGCRVIVEVNERTPVPEMVPTNRPCNIISAKDAQVVYVNVRMGRLVPLVGDGVNKGELLVSGVVKGKFDNTYYVHATGEIIGRYDEKIVFTQKLEDEINEYDDYLVRKSFYFFGLKIPLYINNEIEGNYEYNEVLNNFKLLKLTLPIGIVISEYHPYTITSVVYTEDEAENILKDKVKRYEYNFLKGDDIRIIDKKVRKSVRNGEMTMTVDYIIEGNIAVSEEILAKK